MKKSDIRKKIYYLRKKNYSKNKVINLNVFFNFLKKFRNNSKVIGGYYPFNYELNIMNILEMLEKKKYKISLPKVNKDNMMDFFHWSTKDPLKINKYGIPETISMKKVYPKILLIPLVAFDSQLYRLGYGGGYYDRYISKYQNTHKLIKIGIGFSYQKIIDLPINEYDKKLDYLITENGIIG